jgi:TRAP-type C4-dicarboxylate transport system permease small subunit
MTEADGPAPPEVAPSFIERVSGAIAVAGGMLSLAVALLVTVSVLGRRFFDSPVSGDFELVQMATAIAVFSFLPYCEARRGNIAVDTFTTWCSPRTNAIIDGLWGLVYATLMGLMSACLIVGALEHFRSGQTTMVLLLPLWPAIAVCAVLALLLTLVALVTGLRLLRHRA